MSDVIHLLTDAVANQIAAGEVIQRPASVVKEMMENSIDAGATEIKLLVKEAGKTLVQVIDNGCGMSETDARMAFERHATSKINKADDLFAIKTMGFRGEAMASIAAIAHVELKTRQASQEAGTVILVEGTEVKKHEPCATTVGTSIAVKNLFFNVPARRNFLKSNPVELRHIFEEFNRVALAHPEIAFQLFHNNEQIYQLSTGNLKQRIVGILGKNYNERLVPVEETTDIVDVKGFVGKPQHAKKTRGEQYFFVNNRFIKSPYLNHAVTTAFDELLPDGAFPLYVLFIEIDPSKIDINVHPTKTEIKFEEEQAVYAIIRSAVKRSLGKYNISPTLDFDNEMTFNNSGMFMTGNGQGLNTGGAHSITPNPSSGGGGSNSGAWGSNFDAARSRPQNQWESLFDPISSDSETRTVASADEPLISGEELISKEGYPTFQFMKRYVVTHLKSGILVIDQHLAHERILFERFMSTMQKGSGASQQSLFPEQVEFNAEDFELIKVIMDDLRASGFDISEFGKRTVVVNGLPADLQHFEAGEVLHGLLESFKKNVALVKFDKREQVAKSLAAKSAIKAGQTLSEVEMAAIIDELFSCSQPYAGIGGKPTLITLGADELERRFSKGF